MRRYIGQVFTIFDQSTAIHMHGVHVYLWLMLLFVAHSTWLNWEGKKNTYRNWNCTMNEWNGLCFREYKLVIWHSMCCVSCQSIKVHNQKQERTTRIQKKQSAQHRDKSIIGQSAIGLKSARHGIVCVCWMCVVVVERTRATLPFPFILTFKLLCESNHIRNQSDSHDERAYHSCYWVIVRRRKE